MVTEASTTLFSSKISKSSGFSVTPDTVDYAYTFKEKGEYQVIIQGVSPSSAFQPFKAAYDVSVAEGEGEESHAGHDHASHTLADHFLHIILFGAALLICIAIIIRGEKKKP